MVTIVERDDYKRRVESFQKCIRDLNLNFALKLSSEKDSGFAVLMLTCAGLEAMGTLMSAGSGQPEAIFSRALIKATGCSVNEAKMLYDRSRCGLLHLGCIKTGLSINSQTVPLLSIEGGLFVEPVLLLKSVISAFDEFCQELANASPGSQLRTEFERNWHEWINKLSLGSTKANSANAAAEVLGTTISYMVR